MAVLITGATGFIGRAVCERLVASGEVVHALIRPRAPLPDLGENVRIFTGDVGDPDSVVAAAEGCELAVHAAAIANHRASERALLWVNAAGTENVINATREAGVRRLVHISCSDVSLTNADRVHWNEARGPNHGPIDTHSRSKLLAEELVLANNGPAFETTALRPAWLWGPGDTTNLPMLCREGLHGGIRMVGGGKNLLSVTHIDNLVAAVMLALHAELAPGQPFYVTDGTFIEARELFVPLSAVLGLPAPRHGLPYALAWAAAQVTRAAGGAGPWPTDVIRRGRSTQFDQMRLVRDLGYEAPVSQDEGLRRLATWATSVGGAKGVAAMERAPASAQSVDAQVAGAGGDRPERPAPNGQP